MERVAFDRFLQDLADHGVTPDPGLIQDHDVAGIWDAVPEATRQAYRDELGLPPQGPPPALVEGDVVFENEAPPGEAPEDLEAIEPIEDASTDEAPKDLIDDAEPLEADAAPDEDPAEALDPEEDATPKATTSGTNGQEGTVEEVEIYPVFEPYAYVRISYDTDDHQYLYEVLEPKLDDRETRILDFIQETIVDVIDVGLSRLTKEQAEEMLIDLTNQVLRDYSIEVTNATRLRLTYYVVRDFLGFGKLDVIMRDDMIEDVSCDGVDIPIFLYHRKYESMASTIRYTDETNLDSFVIKLAQRSGQHISIADPLLDARLPDGSRLNATLSDEVTSSGSTFTIRKFREEPFTPPDLIRFGTMSPEMLAYFWMSIQHGSSMIVAGGTASGKTTTLNAVLLFIPPQMKIVSIEDTRELNLPHPNWIPGTTRSGFGPRDEKGRQAGEIDMFQLLKAALRQRPEYITVGEVRGEEATVLFQAMATGHAAYGTMHADSVTSVIHRLEGEPINIPRPLLEALDIVSIQIQTRTGGTRVRRTKTIVEIVGMDPNTKELLTNEVFTWDPATDTFDPSGISYVLEQIQKEENLSRAELEQEIDNRSLIIRWMVDHEIRDYQDVAKVVQTYYNEADELMPRIRTDLGLIDGEEGALSMLGDQLETTDEAEASDPADGATDQAPEAEEEPDEEDEATAREGTLATFDLPTPDDFSEISPLTEEELARIEETGDFDPVSEVYEKKQEEPDAAEDVHLEPGEPEHPQTPESVDVQGPPSPGQGAPLEPPDELEELTEEEPSGDADIEEANLDEIPAHDKDKDDEEDEDDR